MFRVSLQVKLSTPLDSNEFVIQTEQWVLSIEELVKGNKLKQSERTKVPKKKKNGDKTEKKSKTLYKKKYESKKNNDSNT